MKLLASGDWQIGVGADLGRRPGDRLRDQADICKRIASLASEREADAVLLGGDLLHGPAAAPEHLAILADFVRACPCPVLAITGNGVHDLAMRDVNGLAILNHIPGIAVAAKPDVHLLAGAAVAVLPWVHPGRFIAAHGRGDTDDLNTRIAELLVDVAAELREECEALAPEAPAVLLAHWAISGASLPTGLPSGLMGEPVIPKTALQALGFHAVIASHIHVPQLLWDGGTVGLYTGSPMPHDFGETGYEHGVWVVEVGESMIVRAEFVAIPSRAFVMHDLDLVSDEGIMDLARLPVIPEGAIVRVRYRATADQNRSLDIGAWRRELLEQGAAVVRTELIPVREERARVAGLDEQVGELEALEQWIRAEGLDGMGGLLRARVRGYLEAAV